MSREAERLLANENRGIKGFGPLTVEEWDRYSKLAEAYGMNPVWCATYDLSPAEIDRLSKGLSIRQLDDNRYRQEQDRYRQTQKEFDRRIRAILYPTGVSQPSE